MLAIATTGPLFKKLGILPLDELIKYSQLKFMHDYFHGKLPLSFNDTWIQNRNRNPDLALCNANNLYVPAYQFATTKRFHLFTFPKIWNDASESKYNPSRRVFLKSVKSALLYEINALDVPLSPPPPPPSPIPPSRAAQLNLMCIISIVK
jgi:hypothetical protein